MASVHGSAASGGPVGDGFAGTREHAALALAAEGPRAGVYI